MYAFANTANSCDSNLDDVESNIFNAKIFDMLVMYGATEIAYNKTEYMSPNDKM